MHKHPAWHFVWRIGLGLAVAWRAMIAYLDLRARATQRGDRTFPPTFQEQHHSSITVIAGPLVHRHKQWHPGLLACLAVGCLVALYLPAGLTMWLVIMVVASVLVSSFSIGYPQSQCSVDPETGKEYSIVTYPVLGRFALHLRWDLTRSAARAIRDAYALARLSERSEPNVRWSVWVDCLHLLEALLAQDELWESIPMPTALLLSQVHQALAERRPTALDHLHYRWLMVRLGRQPGPISSPRLLEALLQTPGRARTILRRSGFRAV